MLKRSVGSLGLVCVLGVAAAGCGEDPEPVTSGVGPVGTPDAGQQAPHTGPCPATSTMACDCNNNGVVTSGTTSCYQGVWTSCSCNAAPATNTGQCKAGHYEGDFEGWYRSGFILGAAIPVFSLDISFGPALKFTLEEQIGGDAEFPVYKIADGEINGTADFLFPFKARLTGTLDCRTKTLTGEMDGGYSIVLPVGINEGKFIGPVMGNYDASNHTFTGGTWDLHEEDHLMISVLGMTGGEGTWKARWVSPP